jgi:hypothetical protein
VGSDRHECIQISCPTFPYFALSECPSNVQIILGVYHDSEKLIETFDPAHAKWVTHEAWMPRDLAQCPYVLYRDRLPGVPENPPGDMEVEVNALLERVKYTRKRLRSPIPIDALPNPGPRKRQKGPSNKAPATQTRDAPEHQSPAALAAAPSSAHARWPLKYVVAMSTGFHRMASASGTRRQRFEAAFNLPFPPKATYHDNINIWDAAHEELKGDYIEAGYSDDGLWKNFRRHAIMARCADEKVSDKRPTTLNRSNQTEIPELKSVKREVEVIYVLD